MRFKRQLRYDYTVTDRKRSAASRWQRRQREALPLLGELIAETQPSIDEVMDTRVSTWITSQERERDRRADLWRQGRRGLEAHPPTIRSALLAYWNKDRWLPGDPTYLLDLLHGFSTGRLVLKEGSIQPARITVFRSESLAAFETSKPRAQGWLAPSGIAPRKRRAG